MHNQLVISRYGSSAHGLFILHGLFGAATNWTSMAQALATDYRVVVPDLRNHGGSFWDPMMNYPAMAEDLRDLVEAERLDLESCTILGHSMGGKVAMQLALDAPQLVDCLIIADIAPISYPPQLRAYADAMRRLDLSSLAKRADADEALAEEIDNPAIRAFLLQNLRREESGWRWRLNLDVLSAQMDELVSAPRMTEEAHYDGPTLFLRGGKSDYVPDEALPILRRHFPNARIETVENAGHWLHAEQPKQFLEIVQQFLKDRRAG